MTQEQKELLLKDLSARLPYGVKLELMELSSIPYHTPINLDCEILDFMLHGKEYLYKPYLRPMDSMTEEELKCFQAFHCVDGLHPHFFQQMCNLDNETAMFNWLNKNMFDYRGLIPKGLALEAPEGMYIIK